MSNKIAEPLSDNDVDKMMKRIANCNSSRLTNIFIEYSDTLTGIISLALAQAKASGDEDDIVEIERARRVIGFCPLEEKLLRTKDKIWNVREHIINKNTSFFLDRDYSGMIKKDGNKAFIEALMEIVKNNFTALNEKEQNQYWKKAKKLLRLVAEFKRELKDD